MFVLATRAVFVEVPVTATFINGVSGSPRVKGTVMGVSSCVTSGAMELIVGASGPGLTVTVKLRTVVVWPSLTVTVIRAWPFAFGVGVNVNVPAGLGLE